MLGHVMEPLAASMPRKHANPCVDLHTHSKRKRKRKRKRTRTRIPANSPGKVLAAPGALRGPIERATALPALVELVMDGSAGTFL